MLPTAQEQDRSESVPRKTRPLGHPLGDRIRHALLSLRPEEPLAGLRGSCAQDEIHSPAISFIPNQEDPMELGRIRRGRTRIVGGLGVIIPIAVLLGWAVTPTRGGDHPWGWFFHKHAHHTGAIPPGPIAPVNGGYWLWMLSPE